MRQVQLAQKILFKLNFKSLFWCFFLGGGYLESQKRTKSPLMFIDTVDMIKTQGRFLASFFANKERQKRTRKSGITRTNRQPIRVRFLLMLPA